MSDKKPETKPEPDARRDEATGSDQVSVDWKGETYTVPRSYDAWPFAYTLEMQRGRSAVAFQYLLGEKQFARFLDTTPTNSDFVAFDVLMGEALGASQGESPASSD